MTWAKPAQSTHTMEIQPNTVYTIEEAQNLLKVSRSTMLRLVRKGALHAGRIGAQYRFLGRDLLHMVNPAWEDQAREFYRKTRDWANEKDA